MLKSRLATSDYNSNSDSRISSRSALIKEGASALLTVSELRDIYSRLAPLIQIADRFIEGTALKIGIELAGVLANDHVLEIGLGARSTLIRFKENQSLGMKLGVDINRSMIETSLQSSPDGEKKDFRFCECDARALPFPEATFDLVFCAYVLDTLSLLDIDTALTEARRVLRPSGRMVIVHISARNWWFNQAWKPVYWFIPNLLGGCRPIGLTAYLPFAGFRVLQTKSVTEWGIPSEVLLLLPTE